jgi:hypothetical protein
MSLEIDPMDICVRMAAHIAGVNWSHVLRGRDPDGVPYFTDTEVDAIGRIMTDLTEEWPLHITPRPEHGWHPDAIEENVKRIRRLYPQKDILVILDYLQIVQRYPGESADIRALISDCTMALQRMASEQAVNVWCISSLSREAERRLRDTIDDILGPQGIGENVVSRKEDVVGVGKESGTIEYAADVVMVSTPMTSLGRGKVATVIAKNRTGDPTWVLREFDGHRYVDASDGAVMVARMKLNEAAGVEPGAAVDQEYLPPRQKDLPPRQKELLSILDDFGEAAAADVANAMGFSRPMAVKRLHALKNLGLVVGRREASSGRVLWRSVDL